MNRGPKLSDDRTISGENHLTSKLIDKFTIYNGNGIRKNNSSTDDMCNSYGLFITIIGQRISSNCITSAWLIAPLGVKKAKSVETSSCNHKGIVSDIVRNAINLTFAELSSL
ncbi:hypothetical protein NPIL_225181 [Nephila pilipes]|uniref:Uncharacterized protein n=1 Tax=Nephila pilipes TaxID=299642 RepID=A0A8X6T3U6_NEPPI|nr:hypothetical protein NPIL_225181 [Nephila pilipes]